MQGKIPEMMTNPELPEQENAQGVMITDFQTSRKFG